MKHEEITNIFNRIMNNLDIRIEENIPTKEFLVEAFKPNSQLGLYLFSIYTMVINLEEVVIEGDMLLSFTDSVSHKVNNPIVLLTNTFLLLKIIELVEDTPNRIRYKFLNEEIKQMFKTLEQIEFKQMKNKYLELYQNGMSQDEILKKMLEDLENESRKIKSYQ